MEKRESLTDVRTASRQSNAACEQADTFPNFYQGMMIASIEADHEIHIRRHFGLKQEKNCYYVPRFIKNAILTNQIGQDFKNYRRSVNTLN